MKSLRDAIREGNLVCDGAMGTQLLLAGLQPGESPELWNATQPKKVEAIHRAYADAGAHLVTSNTFGGSSINLAKHGLADRMAELNRAGVALAKNAVGSSGWVLGDIGPFGDFLEPIGDVTESELTEVFAAQAEALRAGGADGFIVETMADPAELSVAVRAARLVSDAPVIATFAFRFDEANGFHTIMGTRVAEAVLSAIEAGADVVGANCGTDLGLADYVELAEVIVGAANGHPTILQPNAGAPQVVDSLLTYRATPSEMADLARSVHGAGISIVGGCCGTTPEHIRAIRSSIA